MPLLPTYREAVEGLSPAVFKGYFGSRLVGGMIGLMGDLAAEAAREAALMRFFDAVTFPEDALAPHGDERLMPRYPTESADTYKSRLRDAWNAWNRAGTDQAIITQLAGLGLTAEIYANHEWNWDSDTDNWSRFWVVVTSHPWSRWHWSDGTSYGGGATWGSTATPAEIYALRRLVRTWKVGHVVCSHIILVMDPATWSPTPDGTWGDPANRNAGAIYIPG